MYARVLFSWPPEPQYRALTNEIDEIEDDFVSALTRIVDLAPLPLANRNPTDCHFLLKPHSPLKPFDNFCIQTSKR